MRICASKLSRGNRLGQLINSSVLFDALHFIASCAVRLCRVSWSAELQPYPRLFQTTISKTRRDEYSHLDESLSCQKKHENIVDFLGCRSRPSFRSQLEKQLCSSLAASALKPADTTMWLPEKFHCKGALGNENRALSSLCLSHVNTLHSRYKPRLEPARAEGHQ